MVGPLTPKPGETSADFKLRIEQAQREQAATRTPPAPPAPATDPEAKTPGSVPPPQAPPKPPPAPGSEPPAQPAAEAPKPAPAAATPAPSAKPDDKVDPLEWARKKGLKTPEDVARSLRSLETEFHRRNQQPRTDAPPAQPGPYIPPQPQALPYQPAPPPYQPQPAPYAPPAPRYQPAPAPLPRHQLQWIADTYAIPVEDAERLAPLVMDMVAASQRQADQRFVRLERDNARNAEMFRLLQDPSFQHPEVQYEMHRVLEEEPRIFELEIAPYTVAFNRALMNIARKHVATGHEETPAPETPPLSSRPPSTLGADGGSGGKASPEGVPVNVQSFNQLSLDKKREMLTALGARTAP